MKRLGFAVVMLCAVSAWAESKPYTSAALGFTATFPFEVKEQADPAGGGTAAAFDPQGVMYMVGVSPTPADQVKGRSVKEQLDDGLAGMVAKVNGKLVSQKDVKLGKYPGREAEIEVNGGKATFRAYLVGATSYLLGVVHKDGVTPPVTAAEFFKSFKLNKK